MYADWDPSDGNVTPPTLSPLLKAGGFQEIIR